MLQTSVRKPGGGANQFNTDALPAVRRMRPDTVNLGFKYDPEWGLKAQRRAALNIYIRYERSTRAADHLSHGIGTEGLALRG